MEIRNVDNQTSFKAWGWYQPNHPPFAKKLLGRSLYGESLKKTNFDGYQLDTIFTNLMESIRGGKITPIKNCSEFRNPWYSETKAFMLSEDGDVLMFSSQPKIPIKQEKIEGSPCAFFIKNKDNPSQGEIQIYRFAQNIKDKKFDEVANLLKGLLSKDNLS